MQIRLMTLKDYHQVLTVWQTAGLNIYPKDDSKKSLLRFLKMNPKSCLVAEVGKKIVGGILGAFNGRRAWIYHLAVHPKYQKQGIGLALVEKLEQYFTNINVYKIKLDVLKSNVDVIPFYKKLGYVFEEECIVMEKKLP